LIIVSRAAEDKKAQERICELAVAVLTKFVPGIRLFVDRQELQTGVTLYSQSI